MSIFNSYLVSLGKDYFIYFPEIVKVNYSELQGQKFSGEPDSFYFV